MSRALAIVQLRYMYLFKLRCQDVQVLLVFCVYWFVFLLVLSVSLLSTFFASQIRLQVLELS